MRPYKFGLFLKLDGMVVGVQDNIDSPDFWSLLTIAGRESVDISKNEQVFVPEVIGSLSDAPTIYLYWKAGQPKAHLVR